MTNIIRKYKDLETPYVRKHKLLMKKFNGVGSNVETSHLSGKEQEDLQKKLIHQMVTDKPSSFLVNVPYIVQYMGAAVAVALIIFGSYQIYKRFFSKEAKTCRSLTGKAIESCLINFRKQALLKQIDVLKKASTFCSKSKDPKHCKERLNKKNK